MTTRTDLFLTYLWHSAAKDLQAISAMFAEDIHLRALGHPPGQG